MADLLNRVAKTERLLPGCEHCSDEAGESWQHQLPPKDGAELLLLGLLPLGAAETLPNDSDSHSCRP